MELLEAFLEYIILVLFVVLVAGVAIYLGIFFRKAKNRKEEVAAMFSEESPVSVEEKDEA